MFIFLIEIFLLNWSITQRPSSYFFVETLIDKQIEILNLTIGNIHNKWRKPIILIILERKSENRFFNFFTKPKNHPTDPIVGIRDHRIFIISFDSPWDSESG